MTRSIDYGNMMHRAMRGLIRQVLTDVSDGGLPGEHHFFITFDTQSQGVDVAEWLTELYPEEMTIVIQHWYDDLVVTEDGFSITLNFGDQPERLSVPYEAIRTFVDPSVEFGLRFETSEVNPAGEDADAPMVEDAQPEPEDEPRTDADVVSLDSFRK